MQVDVQVAVSVAIDTDEARGQVCKDLSQRTLSDLWPPLKVDPTPVRLHNVPTENIMPSNTIKELICKMWF